RRRSPLWPWRGAYDARARRSAKERRTGRRSSEWSRRASAKRIAKTLAPSCRLARAVERVIERGAFRFGEKCIEIVDEHHPVFELGDPRDVTRAVHDARGFDDVIAPHRDEPRRVIGADGHHPMPPLRPA